MSVHCTKLRICGKELEGWSDECDHVHVDEPLANEMRRDPDGVAMRMLRAENLRLRRAIRDYVDASFAGDTRTQPIEELRARVPPRPSASQYRLDLREIADEDDGNPMPPTRAIYDFEHGMIAVDEFEYVWRLQRSLCDLILLAMDKGLNDETTVNQAKELIRCRVLGCGLAGACNGVGGERYPCPLRRPV